MAGLMPSRALAGAAFLAAISALSGCSSAPVQATTGSFKSLYASLTGSDVEPTRRLKTRVDQDFEPVCPEARIVPGQAAFTLYKKGGEGDLNAVTYQGTVTRVARECSIGNGTLSMKYGFAGRVVIGPQGGPGKVVLPVNVAFMQDAEKTVWKKQFKVAVDVPDGASSADFVQVVDAFTYQIPPGDLLQTHELRIYFEGDESVPVASSKQQELAF